MLVQSWTDMNFNSHIKIITKSAYYHQNGISRIKKSWPVSAGFRKTCQCIFLLLLLFIKTNLKLRSYLNFIFYLTPFFTSITANGFLSLPYGVVFNPTFLPPLYTWLTFMLRLALVPVNDSTLIFTFWPLVTTSATLAIRPSLRNSEMCTRPSQRFLQTMTVIHYRSVLGCKPQKNIIGRHSPKPIWMQHNMRGKTKTRSELI